MTARQVFQPLCWAAVVAALAVLPLFNDSQSDLTLIFLVFLYATLAQSWNILGGYAGQINLGHAAFFGIGFVVTRVLFLGGEVTLFGADLRLAAAPIWFALLAGGIAAALISLVIGSPAFRLKGVYLAIGTLALGEILRVIVSNNFGEVSSLPVELVVQYRVEPRYYAGLAIAATTSLCLYWLTRSRLGLAMMAIREDESAAAASGVALIGHKLSALAISTFFAGLAGGLYAYFQSSYYHYRAFSPVWTFEALLIVYIGGVGSISGPLLGALFYVVSQYYLAEWFEHTLENAHLYLFGALFIVVVLTWPGGLIQAVDQLGRLIRRRPGKASDPGPPPHASA